MSGERSGAASLALVTWPDGRSAREGSRRLLELRLAASANMVRADSIYWWDGRIQERAEVMAWYNVLDAEFEEFKEAVLSLHPYEVPCVVRMAITDGHGPFLEWVRASSGGPGAD